MLGREKGKPYLCSENYDWFYVRFWTILISVIFNTVLGLKISNLCILLHYPMQWRVSLGLSGICSLPQGVWGECHQRLNLFWAQTQISVAVAGAQWCWAQTQNFILFIWRRRFALSEALYWIPILNSEYGFSNDYFFLPLPETVTFSDRNSLERKKLFLFFFLK